VNDRRPMVQILVADVEKESSETRRTPQLDTGGDPLDQSSAFVRRQWSFVCW
jgi:hypothetical protein